MSLPIKDLFLKGEYLHLKNLEGGYKNVIPSMEPQGLNQLIVLELEYCQEIEYLFDSTVTNVDMLQPEAVFCSLPTLSLHGLHSLKEVFHDPSSQCFLKNLQEIRVRSCDQLYSISFPRNSKLCSLKVLVIYSCPKLTCLFMRSIAQTLVLLESLDVYGCSELKKVIEEGDVDDYVSSQSHTSLMLPKLRSLKIEECDKLEYIFPVCFAQGLVSLEELRVENNREMKYVFGTEKEQQSDHPTNSSQSHTSLMLPKLRSVYIGGCDKLEYIFPICVAQGLVSLEELTVRDNTEMKYVFGSEKEQQSPSH